MTDIETKNINVFNVHESPNYLRYTILPKIATMTDVVKSEKTTMKEAMTNVLKIRFT